MKSTNKKQDIAAMKIYRVEVWYDWDAASLPAADVTDIVHLGMSLKDYPDDVETNPKAKLLSEIGALYDGNEEIVTMYVQATDVQVLAEEVKDWLFEAHKSILERQKHDIKVVFTGLI